MRCIVCGNNLWKYLFPAQDRMFGLPGKFSEYQCLDCGLVRIEPQQSNLKKYYPAKKYYSYGPTAKKSFFR